MQAAIEIPTPNASDSETVATALETAAVFSAKGDTAEAIRWLQRAAESAGDAGDDVRTLTLARTAADLTRELQSVAAGPTATPSSSDSVARRLPKPPLRPSSSFPAPSTRPVDEDESRVTLSRRVDPSRSPTPSAVQPNSTRPPPPPSTRVFPTASRPSGHAGASGIAGTASVASRPPGSNSSKSSLPSVDRRRPVLSTAAPASVVPRAEATPRSEAPSPTEHFARTGDVTSSASEMPADPPPPLETQALVPPNAESTPKRPLTLRPTEPTGAGTRLRLAARVSVVASSTEPGLYFVRLLEEGQSSPSSATEAMMVLLDPSSTLFLG